MPSLKKTSLKDIAEVAGVSPALVSFVLNGKRKKYRVGEETARRILKIAKELNYQPNLAAKSLRSGKSTTIGLVVSDISNPFFAQLARILEDEAAKRGYSVIFGSSDEDDAKLRRIVGTLVNKGVDGLIIVPCENSEKTIESIVYNGIPTVLFDRYFSDIQVSYVALNNFGASYSATNHLLSLGYKSPCMVAYDSNLIHMKERIRGYVKAMEDAGMSDFVTVLCLNQKGFDKAAERQLLQLMESGTDSFFFATNMISLRCLYVLKDFCQCGSCNLGLVSFDGSPVFDFIQLPISYVRQPVVFLVQKALEILLDNMTKDRTIQSVLVDGEFVAIT